MESGRAFTRSGADSPTRRIASALASFFVRSLCAAATPKVIQIHKPFPEQFQDKPHGQREGRMGMRRVICRYIRSARVPPRPCIAAENNGHRDSFCPRPICIGQAFVFQQSLSCKFLSFRGMLFVLRWLQNALPKPHCPLATAFTRRSSSQSSAL